MTRRYITLLFIKYIQRLPSIDELNSLTKIYLDNPTEKIEAEIQSLSTTVPILDIHEEFSDSDIDHIVYYDYPIDYNSVNKYEWLSNRLNQL